MAYSIHFSNQELACRHCGINRCTPEFVAVLEKFRAGVGSARGGKDTPVAVNDAYRCPVHNAEVGGVPKSEHLQGIAADVHVEGMTAVELYWVALRTPDIKGIGRADVQNYLHIDTRPKFTLWCYDAAGKVIPWFDPPALSRQQVAR